MCVWVYSHVFVTIRWLIWVVVTGTWRRCCCCWCCYFLLLLLLLFIFFSKALWKYSWNLFQWIDHSSIREKRSKCITLYLFLNFNANTHWQPSTELHTGIVLFWKLSPKLMKIVCICALLAYLKSKFEKLPYNALKHHTIYRKSIGENPSKNISFVVVFGSFSHSFVRSTQTHLIYFHIIYGSGQLQCICIIYNVLPFELYAIRIHMECLYAFKDYLSFEKFIYSS